MGFYDNIRDNVAAPLIQQYGMSITLKVPAAGTYDPVTGMTTGGTAADYAGYGVIEDYTTREIDGTTIQRGDKKVMCFFTDTTIIPLTSHDLSIAGVQHSIQNVNCLEPGSVAVVYTLQVRR